MSKYISIALISVYLLSSTAVVELLYLPELIIHYFQHCDENDDHNFIDYLAEHYGGEHSKSDDDAHSRLPFKSHEHGIIVYNFHFIQEELNLTLFEFPELCSTFHSSEESLTPQYSGSIWQPPQLG